MASYTSYRAGRVTAVNINAGAITNAQLAPGVRNTYCTFWVFGSHGQCTPGCCCGWTVPGDVKSVTFEAWGAGGNGSGACSCDRCQHYVGASGGMTNKVAICSCVGCVYTICAGGVYRCLSIECAGCCGCTSYVNGYNLSNFCACGGGAGCSTGDWTDGCFSYMSSCQNSGTPGGNFANFTHQGAFSGSGPFTYPGDACHCWKRIQNTTGAATGLSAGQQWVSLAECWIRCGCWLAPLGAGGQNAQTTYCGSGCCGQGASGGSGVVKITYF